MFVTAREVGKVIAGARYRRGLTLVEVARRSGYAKGYVGDIEKGVKNPTLEAIEAVREAVGLTPADLWGAVAMAASTQPVTAEERLARILHIAEMGLRS